MGQVSSVNPEISFQSPNTDIVDALGGSDVYARSFVRDYLSAASSDSILVQNLIDTGIQSDELAQIAREQNGEFYTIKDRVFAGAQPG